MFFLPIDSYIFEMPSDNNQWLRFGQVCLVYKKYLNIYNYYYYYDYYYIYNAGRSRKFGSFTDFSCTCGQWPSGSETQTWTKTISYIS